MVRGIVTSLRAQPATVGVEESQCARRSDCDTRQHKRGGSESDGDETQAAGAWESLEVIDNSPPIMKLIHALVGIQKGKGNENDRNLPDEGPAAKIRVRFVMAPFGGEIDKLPMHKDKIIWPPT